MLLPGSDLYPVLSGVTVMFSPGITIGFMALASSFTFSTGILYGCHLVEVKIVGHNLSLDDLGKFEQLDIHFRYFF